MEIQYTHINIQGRGILVDEGAEIKVGGNFYNSIGGFIGIANKALEECYTEDENVRKAHHKIVFADPELNLEGIPILPNWREWEVEQKAKKLAESIFGYRTYKNQERKDDFIIGFYKCYNHNKKEYTEEHMIDFAKLINEKFVFHSIGCYEHIETKDLYKWNDLMVYFKSLQKLPKYIVMESESVEDGDWNEQAKKSTLSEKSWKEIKVLCIPKAVIKEIIY